MDRPGQGQPNAKASYRPEIDGLRALAVIAVIINHLNKDLLPSGYLGVDIFFVISGYVITLSLSNHSSETFRQFILGFYARRVKRLLPALVVFVVIISLLLCLFNPEPGSSLGLGRRAIFGLSNLTLYRTSTDYFAPATELNPFTHTWSLGVEEQFYLLFPFLIWFTGFGRRFQRGSRNLLLVILAGSIVSLMTFLYLYPRDQPAAYFLMPPRFWELGVGCLVYISMRRLPGLRGLLGRVIPLLLSLALIASLFIPQQQGMWATLVVVALTAALIAWLKRGAWAFDWFTHRWVVWIGLISYSLYLWHWGVLCISRWTVGLHLWTAPLQLCTLVILACASYYWIEKPMRKRWFFPLDLSTLIAGVGLGVVAQALLGLMIAAPKGLLYAGSKENLASGSKNLAYSFSDNYCNIFEETKDALKMAERCGFGSFANKPTIYLLGDSHVGQFAKAATMYARSNHLNIRIAWGSSCLFPAAVVRNGIDKCFQVQHSLLAHLLAMIKKGDVVMIGNSLYIHFNPAWASHSYRLPHSSSPISASLAADAFSREFLRVSRAINGRGAKVIFYIDGLQFKGLDSYPPSGCRREWFRTNLPSPCFASMMSHRAFMDHYFGWRKDWEDGRMRFVLNAYKYSTHCKGDICSAQDYPDSNHFSPEHSSRLFNEFAASSDALLFR